MAWRPVGHPDPHGSKAGLERGLGPPPPAQRAPGVLPSIFCAESEAMPGTGFSRGRPRPAPGRSRAWRKRPSGLRQRRPTTHEGHSGARTLWPRALTKGASPLSRSAFRFASKVGAISRPHLHHAIRSKRIPGGGRSKHQKCQSSARSFASRRALPKPSRGHQSHMSRIILTTSSNGTGLSIDIFQGPCKSPARKFTLRGKA